MAKETFRVGKLSDALDAANVPLSPVVRANGFIFVSGQPPLDPATGELIKGDIRTQTEYVMENLKLCLETAGSSMEKVVKCNVYVTNIAYYDAVNEIYARYFPAGAPPARIRLSGSSPFGRRANRSP